VTCQGKPAIAHRDVKSRNILVMSDGRCCIADLGLAVLQRPPQPGVMPPTSGSLSSVDELKVAAAQLKVGTRRCMAPEILNETINVDVFDSYRQADVYSFALVVWEISRRFIVSGLTCSQLILFDRPERNWLKRNRLGVVVGNSCSSGLLICRFSYVILTQRVSIVSLYWTCADAVHSIQCTETT